MAARSRCGEPAFVTVGWVPRAAFQFVSGDDADEDLPKGPVMRINLESKAA